MKLCENIFYVGAIDRDRRLFDELIPLPDGTTYNSYLIKGSEKTALLDTVDPAMTSVLIENLKELKVERIDYIVAHHGEQDHSGSIGEMLKLYPEAKVVVNVKCRQMLIDLLCLDEDVFIVIEDGQEISLGDKTLRFINIPWVHWPETFATYVQEDRVLFSCDFFGSHFAFDSLFIEDEAVIYEAAKRYYAEIMMPFRLQIRKNLEKVKALDIDMIATSHGPVYGNPAFIIDAYTDWASDDVKNEVVLPYVSMHDSTRVMVDHFAKVLGERGILVRRFNLTETDIGELAMALVDTATVVIGSPTVLAGPHPAAGYAAMLVNALRPKVRFLGVIGSFGWNSKIDEKLKGLMPNLKAEMLDSVLVKGYPRDGDFKELERLADEIAIRHEKLGIK